MFNISFLKTFLITRLLITQLPDMVLIIPYPPMVSIHPDKFIYSGTFSFVRLCCVGGPRMTVLFICSLRCSVCSSLKMESKAAGKMEPPRARHHEKFIILHNKEELRTEHSFTSIPTQCDLLHPQWKLEQAGTHGSLLGPCICKVTFYLLSFLWLYRLSLWLTSFSFLFLIILAFARFSSYIYLWAISDGVRGENMALSKYFAEKA